MSLTGENNSQKLQPNEKKEAPKSIKWSTKRTFDSFSCMQLLHVRQYKLRARKSRDYTSCSKEAGWKWPKVGAPVMNSTGPAAADGIPWCMS